MKKAIWFSRHQPTAGQIADAEKHGFEIVAIEDGQKLGAIGLQENGDVKAVATGLLALCSQRAAEAIFGVWPSPMLMQIGRTANDAVQKMEWNGTPCWSAWNVQRSIEGGKPTFEHLTWQPIGCLSRASLRWLV